MESTELAMMVDLPKGVTPEVLVGRMAVWQDLQNKLLTPDDFQKFKLKDGTEKVFKKRTAWRKLALAFNISDEIVKEEKEVIPSSSPDKRVEDETIWRIYVKATAPNGRFVYGVGACSSREKKFLTPSGSERVVHDVFATAHTRAKNRAISDLLGSGEVSAEEITKDEEEKAPEKAAAAGASVVAGDMIDVVRGELEAAGEADKLVDVFEDDTYVYVKKKKNLTGDEYTRVADVCRAHNSIYDVTNAIWKIPKA